MILEENRKDLIGYRLEQARNAIIEAQLMIDNEMFSAALNRVYYGMFYVVLALALKYKFETSKHQQLIGWFNREFVAAKAVDAKYGKIIRIAFQNRSKGDYDAFIEFSPEEAELMLSDMIEFTDVIKKIIESHNPFETVL